MWRRLRGLGIIVLMPEKRTVKLILVADTHLGFDYPIRPRVVRRRRGEDFFGNFRRVLDRAALWPADCVVHGGDLFFRSKIPRKIIDLVYDQLFEFAKTGIDVVIVPGNHERSKLPMSLLFSLPNVHVFDRPRTIELDLGGRRVAFAGFPCVRQNIRERFPDILAETGWLASAADVKLLCLHQAVEGARVGPVNFTFRYGHDVIAMKDMPRDLAAVLCGHIHRQQILQGPPGRGGLPVPVLYPGSTERTSFAEKDEAKGFYEIELDPGVGDGTLVQPRFSLLPARPMVDVRLDGCVTAEGLRSQLENALSGIDRNAIVRLKPQGEPDAALAALLTGAFLREVFPATMNYQLSGFFPGGTWKGKAP